MSKGGLWAGAVVALIVGAGLLVWSFHSRSVTVGANTFVNPSGIINAFSTPTVVANPQDPSDMVAVYREDRPALSAQLSWSTNGGASWTKSNFPLPNGDTEPFFPDAAFAPNGTLYVVYTNLTGRGNLPAEMFVAKSTNDGRTLSSPVQVAGTMTFQPRILVGSNGEVHLFWVQVTSPTGTGVNRGVQAIVTAVSTDGGATFSAPTPVSPMGGDQAASPSPAFNSSGQLVVAYQDLGPPPTTTSNLSSLVVVHQEGSGFSTPVTVDPNVVSHQGYDIFQNLYPSLAAASGGKMYLAWSSGAPHDTVRLSSSSDAGVNWTTPAELHPTIKGTALSGSVEWVPSMAVSSSGRIDVGFLAERSGALTNAVLAQSTNEGKTFSAVTLSSASFDATIGPNFGNGLPADLGSRLGIVEDKTGPYVVWTDSRLGNSTNGRQDIVSSQVDVPSTGPLTLFLIAGIVVAALGLGLLVGGARVGKMRLVGDSG